jgi:hypothetical protein
MGAPPSAGDGDDDNVNATGMRLLVTLEPPVKPRDAFWGGDGEDETAGHDSDDPRSSLERIMQGKTGGAAGQGT